MNGDGNAQQHVVMPKAKTQTCWRQQNDKPMQLFMASSNVRNTCLPKHRLQHCIQVAGTGTGSDAPLRQSTDLHHLTTPPLHGHHVNTKMTGNWAKTARSETSHHKYDHKSDLLVLILEVHLRRTAALMLRAMTTLVALVTNKDAWPPLLYHLSLLDAIFPASR